jgi:sec-independent protein translocase protein TatA
MFQNLTGWHAVILLVIILLLFGAPKLPALARSLGQSMKIFKAEVKTPNDEKPDDSVPAEPSTRDERPEGSQTQHKP